MSTANNDLSLIKEVTYSKRIKHIQRLSYEEKTNVFLCKTNKNGVFYFTVDCIWRDNFRSIISPMYKQYRVRILKLIQVGADEFIAYCLGTNIKKYKKLFIFFDKKTGLIGFGDEINSAKKRLIKKILM